MATTLIKVEFWEGFWWWFDPERKDWFIGPHPNVGFPQWWKPEYKKGSINVRASHELG